MCVSSRRIIEELRATTDRHRALCQELTFTIMIELQTRSILSLLVTGKLQGCAILTWRMHVTGCHQMRPACAPCGTVESGGDVLDTWISASLLVHFM